MPEFALRTYQCTSLETLCVYLKKCIELGKADTAFFEVTKREYIEAPYLPGLPYICLRIPTGGGKTILAAHSIPIAAKELLRTETPTVLWLVPSQAIRDQTIATLQDRSHPNRRALAEKYNENVRVIGVPEALYAKRADYDGGAVVIVATIQAFRVEETEGRKVYEANGELMDHFTGIPAHILDRLEMGAGGSPIPSLANVLKLHRPIVIVDEAHNVRGDLSFETLARFDPSIIIEFTATPITPKEHDPANGRYASNILHHVSAAELKSQDMIKLPIILRGRAEPNETIADAISWLDDLDGIAKAEQHETGEFIRPVMLVQAEAKSQERPTLHAEVVKKILMDDFNVPEEHIAIATGSTKGLEGVDLFAPHCKIRFIITQQALKEGWDCSFAYVLCTVAEQKSARAVEQILGRVLRLPRASKKKNGELNQAYAFATTRSFQEAAKTLRDGLVSNGFEKIEVDSLVRSAKGLPGMEEGGQAFVTEERLPEGFDISAVKTNVENILKGRIEIDENTGIIRANGALTNYDREILKLEMPDVPEATIDSLVRKSRGARINSVDAGTKKIRFAVPCLAFQTQDGLKLFDRTSFLDIPWKLEDYDAAPILNLFSPAKTPTNRALLDISDEGKFTVDYKDNNPKQAQSSLKLKETGWTKAALINWLDRRLSNSSRRDITRVSSTLFISKALDALLKNPEITWEFLARSKYQIVDALGKLIEKHRKHRQATAYQAALFPQSGLDFETSADLAMVMEESGYGYREPYKGGTKFHKHLFPIVGDLKEDGEEYDCAVHIELISDVQAWIRNTERQDHSFWLQTSSDKFYPDFLALLNDGRMMAIEYKGAQLATNDDTKEKDLIGRLWADRSNGACLFVMAIDRDYNAIDRAISG